MEAQRLRELMRQEKAKRNRPPPKLAVCREAGQLQCQVCKALVNSENLWNAHLRSPRHLRVLETLRRKLEEKKRADQAVTVAEAEDGTSSEKESEPDRTSAAAPPVPPENTATSASSHTAAAEPLQPSTAQPSAASVDEESLSKRPRLMGPLPPEAFDVEQVTLAEVEEIHGDADADAAEKPEEECDIPKGLPAGFFDDEKQEAKSKGIKNLEKIKERKLEMELRRFETTIEKEGQRMEAVRSDLDQVAFNLQSEEECALQDELRSKVEHYRQEIERRKHLKEEKVEDSSDSGSDVEEFHVDWRAKSFG
eukprot:GEMP01022008.1.p1 GENE.GEMP01022008.1~~GEMP01022008.1.p1  ORF type:complete len:309 (+),score=92.20 GEMP01022008.1:25-951(+)